MIALSQTVTVKDNETGELLDLTMIMSELPKVFVTTNSQGKADFSGFKNSEKIIFSRLGYKTQIFSFQEIEKINFEILLSASSISFDEIVVSATRWSQTSKNIPAKISVLSPKIVALYNPQTAADLLAASGEVFVQKSQQGGGSPMIRGFATNRLLYTVDGVRMNSAIFRAGNIQNVISLDPFAIQNTEIFFGPGSVIYGSDAIGGVMSFQTLMPEYSIADKTLVNGKFSSRYSSANNEITHHFDVNLGCKKWALVTSFTQSKFGNLRMGKNGTDEYFKTFIVQRIDNTDVIFENTDPLVQNPTEYSQSNLMQKISFRINAENEIQYGFHYSETSQYSRYDRLIERQSNGLPSSAVWNYGPQIWLMNNLSFAHSKENRFFDKFVFRVAQQYFEESRIDRKFNHYRLRTQLEKVDAYSVNFDFEKTFQKNRFFYGSEYVLNKVNSEGSAIDIRNGNSIEVPDRYPISDWKSLAVYLNYQYVASENFLVQSGIRYSAFKVESDFTRLLNFYPFDFSKTTLENSSTTASLGIVYRPTENWKISANVSTGFRAPNVDDIGKMFDFSSGEVIVPNTDLTAEYAYNAELSLIKVFGDFLKIDITGFYTFLDDAMVRRAFTVNGADSILYNGEMSKVYAIQNAAFAKIYGFNAGFEVKFGAGFSFSTRYNYQVGQEEMDDKTVSPSRHAAPAFGVSRFVFQKNKFVMQLYAIYSAEVSYEDLNEEERQKTVLYATDANGNPYSPSWYALNYKAMYPIIENLSVSAGIENITNQRYRPYSSGLVAAGRNFVFSLKLNF